MFELIKKLFIGLLIGIVSASNHKEYVSLSNQKCMVQRTLIIYILMKTANKFTTIH